MNIDNCVILPVESFVRIASAGLPTRKLGTVPRKPHQSGTDKTTTSELWVIKVTSEKSCTHVVVSMLGSAGGGAAGGGECGGFFGSSGGDDAGWCGCGGDDCSKGGGGEIIGDVGKRGGGEVGGSGE